MAPVNHYIGTELQQDVAISVGDFLMSPNQRYVGVLEPNGSFAVYWNQLDQIGSIPASFAGQQPGRIWWAPGDNPGPHIMVMQKDGNLCIYPGVSLQSHAQDPIWTSGSNKGVGPTYVAKLLNSGALQVEMSGVPVWTSRTDIRDRGNFVLTSAINRSDVGQGVYALSSAPPEGTGGGDQCRASIQRLGPAPTDHQIWRALDVNTPDGDYIDWPMAFRGTVLINRKTGLALGSDGRGQTMMTPFVDDNALWDRGSPEYGTGGDTAFTAIRLRRDNRFNLNVKGDPPYRSGTEVILWDWKGAQDNLVWRMTAVQAVVPA
jgi:hypothetical protein